MKKKLIKEALRFLITVASALLGSSAISGCCVPFVF